MTLCGLSGEERRVINLIAITVGKHLKCAQTSEMAFYFKPRQRANQFVTAV